MSTKICAQDREGFHPPIQSNAFLQAEDSLKLNGAYLKGYWLDTKYMVTAPFRWKKKDWIKAGLIGGTTAALAAIDHDFNHWVARNRENTSNTISDIFEPLGRAEAFMPWSPVIVMYTFGAVTKNYRTKKTALLAAESFIISTAFTRLLKVTVRRERPFSTKKTSFPSGHASSVFAVATVLAHEYRRPLWVPTLLYTASALTSLSRINDLKHWSSDVFFGFIIGFFTGRTIYQQHNADMSNNLSISPILLQEGIGFRMVWKMK